MNNQIVNGTRASDSTLIERIVKYLRTSDGLAMARDWGESVLTECRKIYTVARACSATRNNGPLIIRDSPAPLLACKLRKSSNAALYRVQANIRGRQTERESRKMTEHDRTNRASCNSKEKKTKKESTKKKGEVEWNNEEHEEVEE